MNIIIINETFWYSKSDKPACILANEPDTEINIMFQPVRLDGGARTSVG